MAYQRLEGELAALVVAYGIATEDVLADWRTLLPWAAGAAVPLLGGIGAGAHRLETAPQAQAAQLQELQRSEGQFRALTANLPDVVVRLDHDGRHLFANPAVEQATGLPPQAFIGKTNTDLGMPADRVEQWMACLRRVFSNGQPERLDSQYPGPDGPGYWESRVLREPLAPGAEPTVLVISRDITERRRMRQALQLSEQRLREAQQLASIGSWTMDLVSGMLEWSDEVFRILELDPASFLADVADNPGGGGNTTGLLRALLDAGASGVLLAVFTDAALAADANRLGPGAHFEACFNRDAAADDLAQLLLHPARVVALSDGALVGRKGLVKGSQQAMGPSALLDLGRVQVAVISTRQQLLDPAQLEVLGVDLATVRTLVVKSRGHFRAAFDDFAPPTRIVEVDAPGPTSPKLATLGLAGLPWPCFPLDPETAWPV